ncbi:MAG: hypothetical protein QOD26_4204 [Betaproteobacteria bacterium]|jgi:hypothetical protein|nr:hypothetical protein [Betaproteobacteria bacterium]
MNMKTSRNVASILSACAGLLAVPAAWSQVPSFSGSHEVRVDKGETLSDFAWQHKRESVSRSRSRWSVGVAGADPDGFPGNNVNPQLDGHVLKIPDRREDVPVPAPIVHSPR